MKKLGDLLRFYIERSGYTIYGIAKAADIKRPTLQKVISSEKKPSNGLIEQLLPLLKLSAAEREELLTVADIMVNGKERHNQRMYIKGLLEQISDFLYSSSIHIMPPRNSPVANDISEPQNTQLFHGAHSVENLICQMIEKECCHKDPILKINVPGNQDVLNKALKHTIFSCPNYDRLHVSHITNLIEKVENGHPEPAMENLRIFSNLLPFIIFSDFSYQVHYYYSDWDLADTARMAFPYYVIGTDWGILLSGSCDSCLFCSSKGLLLHLHNQFEAELARTLPLSSVCRNPEDILVTLLACGKEDASLFCMEYQPCFATYLTEYLIRRYTKPGILHYEENVGLVLNRVSQLNHLKAHCCIFSKSSLLPFIEHGYIDDFPEDYACPLSLEDRLYMLDRLYQDIANDSVHMHRMVNPYTFLISERFSYIIIDKNLMIFLGYSKNLKNYNYVIIREPWLIHAFDDFSEGMLGSSLVYSKEDTLAYIQQCMDMLKSRING